MKNSIINYLKKIFLWKNLFFKFIALLITASIVCTISFVLRNHFISLNSQIRDFMGDFIGIKVTYNYGVAFSWFDSSTTSAYVVQSLSVIITLLLWIFIKDKIASTIILVSFVAGLCNLIDRAIIDNSPYYGAIKNAVVDYFYFKFISNSAIFNINDIFIILSYVSLFIYIVVRFFIDNKKENNENDKINNIQK